MQYPKFAEAKTATHKVVSVDWNPGMDLLAIIYDNGNITLNRFLSLKKIWSREICGDIKSTAWRPDGGVIAIGAYHVKTKENICSFHHVEDGREIHSISKDCEITAVDWFSFNESNNKDDPLRGKNPIVQDTQTQHFSHELAQEQTQLNLLLIATIDGRISLYALGLFHLGDVLIANEPVKGIQMSDCLRYMTLVGASNIRVTKLDILQERTKETLKIAKMYAKIVDEMEYLKDTFSAAVTSWTDVMAGLDKLSYCGHISADDLLELLVLGHPSDKLEKFLADISEKGLRKLNNSIEQTCTRIQNITVKNAQKCCYHLHKDLVYMLGMVMWRDRYSHIELEEKAISDAINDVGSLMLKLAEFQQVVTQSLRSANLFFKWLISVACRMNGEHNDSNSIAQNDIQLLTDFIQQNFDYNSSDFTLRQVGQYLTNDSLSRLKYSFRQRGNFWINFIESRPELQDVFYTHRADASLLQEYDRTCTSIRNAFEPKACKFTQVLCLHNPTQKLDVSLDIKSLQHHVLLQTTGTRQYLISQSLEDKTFELISVEFKRFTISDSCFYGNTVFFLLHHRENNETLMVQVELDKIRKFSERPQKDTRKLLRNMDAIEKNSCQVILDIDSGPADMMVKRIKGVLGLDMFASSSRGAIAFTSTDYKRLHLYELDSAAVGAEIEDDEVEGNGDIDESSIDNDLLG